MDGHMLVIALLFSTQNIYNRTLKVPNNKDGMNRIYCYLLFSVTNTCTPERTDGQTDRQGQI